MARNPGGDAGAGARGGGNLIRDGSARGSILPAIDVYMVLVVDTLLLERGRGLALVA